MKFIPTRVHGLLDYAVAALFIALPFLFDFDRNGAESWIFISLGIATIVYSLLTDYELGLIKTISMQAHLLLDLLNGIFLAASPWIFNFHEKVYLPHLLLGLTELLVVVFSQRIPYKSVTGRRKH
ncbi:MAG: hypothetical protein H0W62_07630 [Chitinophagales bacterium]|nr:hypothetical protein [Chitinophagales bacterium]